jgi:8-oxo-dGTP diphosphatase
MDDRKKRQSLRCLVYSLGTLKEYKYVVVWETQGGHIEQGETPLDAAQRELYEESGVSDAEIIPVCDYYGYDDKGHSNGVVFLAKVHSLGTLPESEMERVQAFAQLPENLTYPSVTPVLMAEALKCEKE